VFVSRAYEDSVKLDFSLTGKHLNNPFDESFNEKIRDVGLKVHSYL
jgi:hypothetical protein